MATRTLISRAQLQRPSGRRAYRVALVLTVVVFTVVFIGPIYFLFTDGFKSTQEVIQTPPTFWPQGWHLSVYQQAWNELDLGKLLFNTLYYAFGALVFQLVFDVAAAYAFSKLRPRFGNVILGMMLASLMIPAAVLLVPQYVTATDVPLVHMNLINSPEAIWLPSVASAFNIFLLKRFFDFESQAPSWAAVGAAKAPANHSRVGAVKRSSGLTSVLSVATSPSCIAGPTVVSGWPHDAPSPVHRRP